MRRQSVSLSGCAPWCDACNLKGGYCCDQKECSQCTAGCLRPPPPGPPPSPPAGWPSPPSPPPDTAEYWTEGELIHTNAFKLPAGESLIIKGVSWFGLESGVCFIGGGQAGPLSEYASFLKQQGFNAVRIPLAADAVLADRAHCMNPGIYTDHNGVLEGKSYLDILEVFLDVLSEHGLLVLLDVHNMRAGELPERGWPANGEDVADSVSDLFSTWGLLAQRFCSPHRFWHVFAADLKNEPHGLYWGPAQGDTSRYPEHLRWDVTAAELGSAVHGLCNRWLLFVEGVGHCRDEPTNSAVHEICKHPAAAGQDVTFDAFWGENLQGVRRYPVIITDPASGSKITNKVVYSPHSYGPSVYKQTYFEDPDFATRMPTIWDMQYGFIVREKLAPVVLGEWGGKLMGDDAVWQEAFRDYLKESRMGSFYWSLNPESADTGGLITGWTLPLVAEEAKLQLLAQLPGSYIPAAAGRTWTGEVPRANERAAQPLPLPSPPPTLRNSLAPSSAWQLPDSSIDAYDAKDVETHSAKVSPLTSDEVWMQAPHDEHSALTTYDSYPEEEARVDPPRSSGANGIESLLSFLVLVLFVLGLLYYRYRKSRTTYTIAQGPQAEHMDSRDWDEEDKELDCPQVCEDAALSMTKFCSQIPAPVCRGAHSTIPLGHSARKQIPIQYEMEPSSCSKSFDDMD